MQRKYNNNNTLLHDRYSLLDSIKFDWGNGPHGSNTNRMEMYQRFMVYKKEHDDSTKVPQNYEKDSCRKCGCCYCCCCCCCCYWSRNNTVNSHPTTPLTHMYNSLSMKKKKNVFLIIWEHVIAAFNIVVLEQTGTVTCTGTGTGYINYYLLYWQPWNRDVQGSFTSYTVHHWNTPRQSHVNE